jgi:threonine dehydratase
MTTVELSLDLVRAAARRLHGHVVRTPVVVSQSFNAATGHSVFFKCENLQRAGSFKIRGAFNKIAGLEGRERARGVVAFSSGNHAQGVALAARMLGTTAIICMPTDAPALKVEATRGYGAEVRFYDRLRDDREAMGRDIARESGRVLVPPYDDYAVMAGQGTAALELLEDAGPLDALVAPVGGGGLMAGCSTVVRALAPGAVVTGVEADSANDTFLSLQQGARVNIPPPPTMADGIRATTPGALTFPVLRRTVTEIALVSEGEIAAAVRFLALRAKLVTEPTGAVGAAAVLAGKVGVRRGARIGIILSGGNVDPARLAGLLVE